MQCIGLLCDLLLHKQMMFVATLDSLLTWLQIMCLHIGCRCFVFAIMTCRRFDRVLLYQNIALLLR